jgi:hypothetical protein
MMMTMMMVIIGSENQTSVFVSSSFRRYVKEIFVLLVREADCICSYLPTSLRHFRVQTNFSTSR